MTTDVALLSARSAARRLHVRDASVLRWLESGELGGYRTDGGQWRIPLWSLAQFEEKRIAAQQEAS